MRKNAQEFEELLSKLTGNENQESEDTAFKQPLHSGYKLIGDFLPGQYVNPMHPKGHDGEDWQAASGTPVYSVGKGTVLNTDDNPKGGHTVKISHPGNYTSYYAHLNSVEVHSGQEVDSNTIIGTVGNTGNAQHTSPHLHWSVKSGGSYIKPSSIIGKSIPQDNEPQMRIADEMFNSLTKISQTTLGEKILKDYLAGTGIEVTELIKQADGDLVRAGKMAKSLKN